MNPVSLKVPLPIKPPLFHMKNFATTITLLVLALPVLGQEKSSAVAYQEKRVQQLTEENQKLEKEISDLEVQVKGLSDGSIVSFADLAQKTIELEADLIGKSAILERMKKSFFEKFPFQKGQNLGSFTTTKGVEIKDATVTDVGPDGVALMQVSGLARLRGIDFPAEMFPGIVACPVSDDISQIADATIKQRPINLLKSAAFAKTRAEMARQRTARLQSEAATSPKSTQAGSSITSVLKERSEREAERALSQSEAIARNQVIKKDLNILHNKIETLHAELVNLEFSFMKDTMAYEAMKIAQSVSARKKEYERREGIIEQYDTQNATLRTTISELEKKEQELMSEYNSGLEEGQNSLSPAERKQKISEIRNQVKVIQTELRSMNAELDKTQSERSNELNNYDSTLIKGDRKAYELKMQKFDSEIIRLFKAIRLGEKKIRDLENSIPYL
jgi:hypothetical protein